MTALFEGEVLRYLGAPPDAPEALRDEIRDVWTAMEGQIVPRSLWREFSCSVDTDAVAFGGVVWRSVDLARHLRGCEKLLLFAATLGAEADRMVRQEQLRSMTRGAIVHAAGAAMVEQFCDARQEALSQEYEGRGLYLRPRYSPGYGDLSLTCQGDVFRLLELSKHLGLSLNGDFLMTPGKSVTAVIGISSNAEKSFHRCALCGRIDCPFRKEGSS